ncbi:MAG TPA: hypothetical protein VMU43_00080 [Candidatus Acidoferrum sp.]|nr:hypothetical protein [Candidatus Acidoferrum sp.]
MASTPKKSLSALRAELAFIEAGGYRLSPKDNWRPKYMFEDSPMCFNRCMPPGERHCSECALAPFVPEDFRDAKVPCNFVPLNSEGETVDSLYRTGTADELESAVLNWLRKMIASLEKARPENPKAAA